MQKILAREFGRGYFRFSTRLWGISIIKFLLSENFDTWLKEDRMRSMKHTKNGAVIIMGVMLTICMAHFSSADGILKGKLEKVAVIPGMGMIDGPVYVTDSGANKTYVYTVNPDGSLREKKIFADEGYDGLAVDEKGNVYITPLANYISVYDTSGNRINVCFGGQDMRTLFITAGSTVYRINMLFKGI